MRCKVIKVVRALKYIAGFVRNLQPKGRRQMVTDEACVIDEEVRSTTPADFATKHCACLYWKDGEERILSWPSPARMEPL